MFFKISSERDEKNKIYKNKLDIEKLRDTVFKMSMVNCCGKRSAIFVFRHLDEESNNPGHPYGKRYIWQPSDQTDPNSQQVVKQIQYESWRIDHKTIQSDGDPNGLDESIYIAANLPMYISTNNFTDIRNINLHHPIIPYINAPTVTPTGDPFETFYPYIRKLKTIGEYKDSAETLPPTDTYDGTIVTLFPLSGNTLGNLSDVMTSPYISAVQSADTKNYSTVFCGTRDTLYGPKNVNILQAGTLLYLLNTIFKITPATCSNFNDYFNNGPPAKAGMFVYYFDDNLVGRVTRNNTISTDTPDYSIPTQP
jgi:hypothetical protein